MGSGLLSQEEPTVKLQTRLTADDLHGIDSAPSKITVHGARYPERLERMTGL